MMNPASPKSISHLRASIRDSRPHEHTNNPMGGFYGFQSREQINPHLNWPSNSRIQSLAQEKEWTSFSKIPSLKNIRSKRPILSQTEEKIFSEVIGLAEQIDSLKSSIVTSQSQIRQFQIQNPDVEEQVRHHGYSQPLTAKQCNDLEEQNSELLKHIAQCEGKKVVGLQDILRIEKDKYQALKQELVEASDPVAASRVRNENKAKELRDMIQELESQRELKINTHYPGIDRLKNQNEQLRQKTIANLKIAKLEEEEEQQLVGYLQREQSNRAQFLEELKKFKNQYRRIKAENEVLKEQLQRKRPSYSKENSAKAVNELSYNRYSSDHNKSEMKVDSFASRHNDSGKKDKLGQYESFIRLMQESLNR